MHREPRTQTLTRDLTSGAERTWADELPRLLGLILPVLLFVAAFVAFLPALDNGLVDFDDHKLLLDESGWRGLAPHNIAWMFHSHVMGHYQPLTWLSYALDVTLLGADPVERPVMFHFTSMVLHAANAVLLYFIAMRLLRAATGAGEVPLRLAAATGALLWAVHPLRVESVAWATERRDVLSGLFLFLATIAYLRAFPPRTVRPASLAWWAASLILLELSILSKAWGMSFFVIAVILDWFPLRRLPLEPWRWFGRDALIVLAQKIPFAVLGIIAAAVASWAQNATHAVRPLSEWPLESRVVQCFYGLVWYPWRTLWPTALCALYELRHGLNPWDAQYLACYAIVAVGGISALLLARRAPAILAAAAAYAVCISPVLGLLQSGDQFVADRYSYLATIPFFVAAAGGILLLARRWPEARRPLIAAAPAALALVLIPATMAQTRSWHDTETLWRHGWEGDPSRMMAHLSYGDCLIAEAKQLDQGGHPEEAEVLRREAIEHFRIGTTLTPNDGRPWHSLGNALRDEARLYRAHGDEAAAMDFFAQAERAFRESAQTIPQAYLPLVNLGRMLDGDLKRPDDAIEAYRQAVYFVENPRPGSVHSGLPYLALGTALERKGDIAAATQLYEKAARDDDKEVREQGIAHLQKLGLR